MKTGKIVSLTFNREYDSKFGTLYSHTIELDNGDVGEISAKEKMPAKYERGKELTYTITPNGKYSPKIKAVNPKYSGQSQPTFDDSLIKELENRIETLETTIKVLVKANGLKYNSKIAEDLEPPF